MHGQHCIGLDAIKSTDENLYFLKACNSKTSLWQVHQSYPLYIIRTRRSSLESFCQYTIIIRWEIIASLHSDCYYMGKFTSLENNFWRVDSFSSTKFFNYLRDINEGSFSSILIAQVRITDLVCYILGFNLHVCMNGSLDNRSMHVSFKKVSFYQFISPYTTPQGMVFFFVLRLIEIINYIEGKEAEEKLLDFTFQTSFWKTLSTPDFSAVSTIEAQPDWENPTCEECSFD